ncbi:MAG: hypothetical protein GXX79_10655 [Actinomycetales bacterium]|nr:hypothetical protein [Actinomycetales bacterium]
MSGSRSWRRAASVCRAAGVRTAAVAFSVLMVNMPAGCLYGSPLGGGTSSGGSSLGDSGSWDQGSGDSATGGSGDSSDGGGSTGGKRSSGGDRNTGASGPVRDVSGRDVAGFLSPSGNIACAMMVSEYDGSPWVRCEIQDRLWDPVPLPEGCDQGGGTALALGTDAEIICITDTIRQWPEAGTDGSVVLQYGTSLRMSPITCTSERSGVTCRNTRTRRGFTVAKASYTLF